MLKTLAVGSPLRIVAAVAALAASAHAGAQATVDKSVGKALDRQKLAAEVDADGDYKLTFEVGGGRTQVVWVRSGASMFGELAVREILSIGANAPGGVLAPGLADRLLQYNSQSKLGAWAKNSDHVVFIARVPVDLEPERLVSAIELVARSADEIEKELGTADAF
jgi:hypothetical protein